MKVRLIRLLLHHVCGIADGAHVYLWRHWTCYDVKKAFPGKHWPNRRAQRIVWGQADQGLV